MTKLSRPALAALLAGFALTPPLHAQEAYPPRLTEPAPLGAAPGVMTRSPGSEAPPPAPAGPQSPEETPEQPTPDEINAAGFRGEPLPEGPSALTAKTQILLDRGGVSPGVIDGYGGENVAKAIRAFEEINGLQVDGLLDDTVWAALQAHAGDAVVTHTITRDDVTGLVAPLPQDYSELAKREWLGYESAAEKIAERFHMDIDFLKALNPAADFTQPGTTIHVADPGGQVETDVARIVADKSLSRLLIFDPAGRLVLSYPVTIGSSDTPSPTGRHEVLGVALDPTYSYDPENFKQGDNTRELTLPPGPNGPVGSVWIDLSKPTYGIHGTSEPAKIGKTASHGCVRMTNWDARELAELVDHGTPVLFAD